MARFRFDDKSIRSAEGHTSRPVIHYDVPSANGKGEYVRGFALQVTPAGSRTFLLCYIAKASGVERRMVVGAYPDLSLSAARHSAKQLRSRVELGHDPWQEHKDKRAAATRKRAQTKHTLGALLEAYCAALERARKPSALGVRRELRTNIETAIPALWKYPANEATLEDLVRPLNRLTRAGKYRQAQKVRSYLRAAYTMATGAGGDAAVSDLFEPFKGLVNIARDLATIAEPKVSADAPEAMEEGGKRALSQPELAAYWERIRDLPGPGGGLLRFHLLTGCQRIAQLARLTEASRVGDTITIMDGKGRRTKNRRHVLPLLPEAQEALQAMRGGKAGHYLFTMNEGRTGAEFHAVRRKVLDVAEEMLAAGEVSESFTPGELRITVETRLQAAGVAQETRAHLQSHGLGGVQNKHYAKHDFAHEKRAALELLRQLCEPVPDNVTPIRRKA